MHQRLTWRCWLLWVGLGGSVLLPSATGRAAQGGSQAFHLHLPEAWAETTPDAGSAPLKPYGLRRLGYDTRHLLSWGARLDEGDRTRLGVALATTTMLYVLRQDIREVVQSNGSASRSRFLQDVRLMGSGRFSMGLALGAAVASFATNNDREREVAQMLLTSTTFSALLAGAGAFVVAAERPEQGTDVRLFSRDGRGVSVDVAIAASVVEPLRCTYLRVEQGDTRMTRVLKVAGSVLLYAGAALTAYQRMDDDKHWAPDVALGMMTGLAVGRDLCRAHCKPAPRRVRMAAWASHQGLCVGVQITSL